MFFLGKTCIVPRRAKPKGPQKKGKILNLDAIKAKLLI